MIIQEENWINVKFSDQFYCTYSLADNQILIIEGCGFSSLCAETESVLFGNNIIETYLPPEKPYIMIQNWKNYKNSSGDARQYFINSVVSDKRLMAIVFCNFTKRQFMSIHLGRALNILTCPVKTCIDKEDALSKARMMLDKSTEIENGSGFLSFRGFISGFTRKNRVNRYVYDILNFLESINWESGRVPSSFTINPNHPMMPVFDMITVIKSRLDVIEKERQEIEFELLKSKEMLEEKVIERTRALQESEMCTREILDYSPVSIAIVDSDYVIRYINKKLTATFGYKLSDVSTIEKILGLICDIDEKSRQSIRAAFRTLMTSDKENRHIGPHEINIFGKTGKLFSVDVTIVRIGGRLLVSVLDMTQRRADSLRLKQLTLTDALTGLNNRRHYSHVIQAEFDRSRRYGLDLSLIIFDIDHFKEINDNFGHPVGDAILTEMAGRCRNVFRDVDQVFRTGGEEFAVILPETDITRGLVAANRLLHDIGSVPFNAGSCELTVTISIGISLLDSNINKVDDFIALTDKKMYKAKQNGRNRIEYT